VPESNPTHAIGQPVSTPSRLAAALIDMAVVAVPTGAVAVAASERFPILDDSGPRPRFSDSDQLRINQIDEGFNRAMRLGDTVFTLSGFGWWLTVLVLVILTTTVFVVLPSKLRRRTPGQSVLGLATTDESDEESEAAAIMIESLAGAGVDAQNPQNPLDWATTDSSNPDSPGDDGTATDSSANDDSPVEASGDDSSRGSDRPDGEADDEPVVTADEPVADHDQPPITTEPVSLGTPDEYLAWDRELAEASPTDRSPTERDQFQTLTLTESSLAESPLNASTATAAPEAETEVAAESAAQTENVPTAESPIWSDLWKAWLYWDPGTDRWFRHDSDDNRWKPLT
jgi:hypothetical protein